MEFRGADIDRLLDRVVTDLDGDWVLVGGALVAAWLDRRRTTEGVDLIPLDPTPDRRLALLELFDELGLPVEAANSAADFFLRRQAGWQASLVAFRSGPRGRFLRPTATLFVLLKLARLTEADLADCLAVLAADPGRAEPVDGGAVLAALAALPPATSPAAAERRVRLATALGQPPPVGPDPRPDPGSDPQSGPRSARQSPRKPKNKSS